MCETKSYTKDDNNEVPAVGDISAVTYKIVPGLCGFSENTIMRFCGIGTGFDDYSFLIKH